MCEFTQDSWKKYRYNLISGNIIKEMPGSVASGTHCIIDRAAAKGTYS